MATVSRPPPLSAEDRAKVEALKAKHLEKLQPQIDALKECSRITAEDLRITILPVREQEKE